MVLWAASLGEAERAHKWTFDFRRTESQLYVRGQITYDSWVKTGVGVG
jgi:hypothetical protein